MTDDRPILYAHADAEGSLVLERRVPNIEGGLNIEHVATLFHPSLIAEVLRDGYLTSNGWQTVVHRVVWG
jgi:hypothetical protein